jgi:hypothetical protein
MADKTITVTITIPNVPDTDDWRGRVLAMANDAKATAYFGGDGEPMPPDHLFIRAALALESIIRHAQSTEPDSASLIVCVTAGQFFQEFDGDNAARDGVLAETLHDPGQWFDAATAEMIGDSGEVVRESVDVLTQWVTSPDVDPVLADARN